MTKQERNYSRTEKVFLAAIWAMESLQYYLTGKEFKLLTDHKALEEVKSKAEFGSARIQRWLDRLERFNFEVVYIQGKDFILANALSRSTKPFIPEGDENLTNNEIKILEIHEEYNHRKSIRNNAPDEIEVSMIRENNETVLA